MFNNINNLLIFYVYFFLKKKNKIKNVYSIITCYTKILKDFSI